MSLFAQAPRFTFKLRSDPVRMARSIKKLLKQVMDLLATNVPGLVIIHDNRNCPMQFTAEAGFFTVLVKPPGDWDPDHPVAPVLLAFSLRDMYLVGYQDNAVGGIWKIYNDAYLSGSGADDPANAAEWQYLPYNGGYIQEMYGVSIGLLPMYNSLQTLNNLNASDMEKRPLAPCTKMIRGKGGTHLPPAARHAGSDVTPVPEWFPCESAVATTSHQSRVMLTESAKEGGQLYALACRP